jgi:hypothetical protein
MWVGEVWSIYHYRRGRIRLVWRSRSLWLTYCMTGLYAWLWCCWTQGAEWGIEWGVRRDVEQAV